MQIIRSSSLRKSDRIFLYGTEGIGKSSFASRAPNPIFLDIEDGLAHLDVPCIPVKSFVEFTAAVTAIPAEYKTLVIDTADALEALLWADLCKRNSWTSIEDPGYGKGYIAATEAWRPILAKFDKLRDNGIEIIILAHASTKNFQNPAGPDYNRYEPKLDKRAASMLKEWSDCILFACHEETARILKDTEKKAKGVGTGKRVIRTQHSPAWDAKNRFDLPETLPLNYAAFAEARAKYRAKDPQATAPKTAAPPAATTPPAAQTPPAKPEAMAAGGTSSKSATSKPTSASPSTSGLGVDGLRALAVEAGVKHGADNVRAQIKAITGGGIAQAKPEQFAAIEKLLKGLIDADAKPAA